MGPSGWAGRAAGGGFIAQRRRRDAGCSTGARCARRNGATGAGLAAAEYASKSKEITTDESEITRVRNIVCAPLERRGGFSPNWLTQVLQGIIAPYFVPHEREFLEGISLSAGFELESEEPIAVGERIRNLREFQELSLGDVSKRTGLSEDMLESIEADAVAPPLGTLTKLARALEMKMCYLLTGGEPKPFVVTRKDERKPVSRHAAQQQEKYGYSYLSLTPGKRDRNMEPFLVTLAPTTEDMPGSVHDGEEFLYVLEGEMEVIIGENREILYPGDAIYYDSSIPHLVKCHQDKPTRILAVLFAETK